MQRVLLCSKNLCVKTNVSRNPPVAAGYVDQNYTKRKLTDYSFKLQALGKCQTLWKTKLLQEVHRNKHVLLI